MRDTRLFERIAARVTLDALERLTPTLAALPSEERPRALRALARGVDEVASEIRRGIEDVVARETHVDLLDRATTSIHALANGTGASRLIADDAERIDRAAFKVDDDRWELRITMDEFHRDPAMWARAADEYERLVIYEGGSIAFVLIQQCRLEDF